MLMIRASRSTWIRPPTTRNTWNVPTHLTAADAARLILEANQHGDEVVSVLATAGPAAGSRIVVFRDARCEGTLGDPLSDDTARDLALHVFDSRAAELRGGLFAEVHAPSEQLLIFGAGHIAV